MFLSALPVIAGPDAPVPPGWWPVPPGWWLLALALFLGLVWTGYLFLRRFLRTAKARRRRELPVRTQALAALDELAHRRPLDARVAAYRLNEILRGALYDARADTRAKKGTVYFLQDDQVNCEAREYPLGEKVKLPPFLPRDGVIEDQQAWECFWRELEARYQPSMTAGDVEHWLSLARAWISRLPVNDV